MCIVCRQRLMRSTLYRLHFDHDNRCFNYHKGFGRSFYLCKPCVKDASYHRRLAKNLKLSLEALRLNLKELGLE